MGDPGRPRRSALTRRLARVGLPGWTLALALVSSGVFFVLLSRGIWFFGDEWTFLLHRRLTLGGDDGVLTAYNGHWSTLPVIAYRLMFHAFGLRHFLPYAAMPIALHLAICVVFFARLRRSGATPWPAVLTTVTLAFLGTGVENVLWPFQIGFLGSAFWGLVALLSFDAPVSRRARLLAVWAGLALSLMCSGMALPMVVWVGVFALLTRGLVPALVATVPPAVLFLVWFVAYGLHSGDSTHARPGELGNFIVVALDRVWDTPGPAGLGLGILVLLGGVAVWGRVDPALHALAVSGVVTTLAAYVLISVDRASLGADAALASRYAYFGALFTLPALAVAVSVVGATLADRPVALRSGALVVAGAVLVTWGCSQSVSFRDRRAAETAGLPARVVASAHLVDSGAPLLSDRVEPFYALDLDADSLRRPDVRRALPRVDPDARERLDARAALQVATSTDPLPVPVATAVVSSVGLGAQTRSGDCVRGRARSDARVVVGAAQRGVQLRITPSGTVLATRLVAPSGLGSVAVNRPVTLLQPVWVGTSLPGAELSVSVPVGRYEICLGATP